VRLRSPGFAHPYNAGFKKRQEQDCSRRKPVSDGIWGFPVDVPGAPNGRAESG